MSSSKKRKKQKYSQQQGNETPVARAIENSKPKTQRRTGSNQTPVIPGSWKTNIGIFLLLLIGTLVLYSGDLQLGFFSVDDPGYILNNPWIKSFSKENIGHILSTPYFANYSPAHLLSYSLDYFLGGGSASAFHLSNNIWAGIVAGFVFLLALAFTRHQIVSIATAVLFVVHPAHVEAVAWISSRKDLVAAAFAIPSLLAYMNYRRGGKAATRWYIISVLLFLISAAGKLSVATFPAVFLALDLFVEKRALMRSFIDKIPFLIVGAAIAMAAASAQPDMGHRPDPYILSFALVQNIWLLTGFGSYVQYRMPPDTVGAGLEIAAVIFLLAIFIAPLLLRKRLPVIVVLIYWILFAFIPSQILSFTHPVADRYMFFPSIAGVIIIAWGIIALMEKFIKQKGWIPGVALLSIIVFFWGKATLDYLSEWKDPRSIWFAASKKSADPIIMQNLASHYMDHSRKLSNPSLGNESSRKEVRLLASEIWKDSSQLQQLFSDWDKGVQGGAAEKQFQNYLGSLAMNAYEKAIATKGNRIMGGLYYNLGLLYLNQDKLAEAKKSFVTCVEEVSRESFASTSNELTVYCHYNLGVIAVREKNNREALKWFRQAEEEQTRFGGNWMPSVSATRKQLESIVASMPPE